ncbi:MAG: hypothetical protein PSV40_14245 [Polaromonas sp.]|uniref:hypothetical protein n=1 Tax=Polaromonas sp. TaxID=1869339 RepID=UPI002487BC88|nr:hypothetical protein [Polaromonas sp.]MDI1270242.1 hypothetical protein [Polaromonas sp.]
MAAVTFTEVSDSIVFYFDTEKPRIRVATLTKILEGIQQAVNATSRANGGDDIAVYLGKVKTGSVWVQIITAAETVTLGVISCAIYDALKQLPADRGQNVVYLSMANGGVAVDEQNYDRCQALQDKALLDGVAKALAAVAADDEIRGAIILPKEQDDPPPFIVTSSEFERAAKKTKERIKELRQNLLQPKIQVATQREAMVSTFSRERLVSREIVQETDIALVRRASKGTEWNAVLDGFDIRATLEQKALDSLSKFPAIRPGDVATARLRILQTQDSESETFSNFSFVIEDILAHKPKNRPRLGRPK